MQPSRQLFTNPPVMLEDRRALQQEHHQGSAHYGVGWGTGSRHFFLQGQQPKSLVHDHRASLFPIVSWCTPLANTSSSTEAPAGYKHWCPLRCDICQRKKLWWAPGEMPKLLSRILLILKLKQGIPDSQFYVALAACYKVKDLLHSGHFDQERNH